MMKNQSKKIISIMLMAGLILAAAALALPNSYGIAAGSITATTPVIEQTGAPGATLYFPVTISNGDASSVTLSTTCNISTSLCSASTTTQTTISPTDVTIAPNSSATIMVAVAIQTTATVGTSEILSIRFNDSLGEATTISLIVHVANNSSIASDRPQLTANSITFSSKYAKVGSVITVSVTIENNGPVMAYNNTITFTGEGFYPQGNGGVQYIQNISPSGGKKTFTQDFMVGDELDYVETGVIKATVAYLDAAGKAYTDTFNISVPVTSPLNVAATATPKSSIRPQLVITKNETDIDPLQPGSIFELNLTVKNLGSTDAKNVNLILGGGAATINDLGTPQPGTSTDLTNFAPLGSSNIVVVGDVAQGAEVSIKVRLVVNVTTAPGAYTLKTSFAYTDPSSKNYVDDQVITLLVYSLPQVDVSFYSDPGMLTAGMPNMLPLQVTNLGKKSSVLGNMTVTTESGEILNNTALVGALDPGGYFTLDSQFIPAAEGKAEITVTINYTDDFNQTREISKTLTLDVMPAPVMTPDPSMGENGLPIEQPVVETFWSKVGRFFKGLFGLDSGVNQPSNSGISTEAPMDSGTIIYGGKG